MKYEEIREIYNQAHGLMTDNESVILDDPSLAHPWLNHPILARWLYISSRESLRRYWGAVKKITERDPAHNEQMTDWYIDLNTKLRNMKSKLMIKFPNNGLLMEELSK